jgi:hypothetical protein
MRFLFLIGCLVLTACGVKGDVVPPTATLGGDSGILSDAAFAPAAGSGRSFQEIPNPKELPDNI